MCYICFASGVPVMPLNLNLSWLSYKNHIPPVLHFGWKDVLIWGSCSIKRGRATWSNFQLHAVCLHRDSSLSFCHLFHYDPPSSATSFCLPVLFFSKKEAEQLGSQCALCLCGIEPRTELRAELGEAGMYSEHNLLLKVVMIRS